MVIMSVVAVVIGLLFGLLAGLDQAKRINDPLKYAQDRCRGGASTPLTPAELATCISHEEKKSTLVSIAPLLAAAIIIGGVGAAGLFVGRQEVKDYNEVMRKLKGED
jgi:hypothetical protein